MANPKKQPVKKTVPLKPLQLKGPFHFKGYKFQLILILSVIGLCCVLYGNSVPNGFSLDDEFVLHNDSTVAKGIKGIPQLFTKRYAWDQKGGYGYRPVVKATFAIESQFFKESPHWGHFINILFYAFVCIFLFYFFRKLLYDHVSDYFLLIVLALYLTHPLHSEVVASLKNRDEMLVFLFGFYCCYAFLKCFETDELPFRIMWGFSACLSLALGVLCKPDAFIFIPITVLVLFFSGKNGIKAATISLVSMMAFLIMVNRFIIKHVLPHTDYRRTFIFIENPLVGVHWYHKIPLAFSTVWFYTSKMLFPKELISYYGYDAFNSFPAWTDFSVIAGILISGLLIYLAVLNIKKRSPLLLILFLFLGTLFPYTDIFQVGAGIVAERFMFIPSVFFILLFTYFLFYLLKLAPDKKINWDTGKYAYGFIIIVCVVSTIRVIARNPDWKSHQSLYAHDVIDAPRSAKLQSLLAGTYIEDAQKLRVSDPRERKKIDSLFIAGDNTYQKSLDIYPEYGTTWNNKGMIQFTLYGNMRNAIVDFKKALAIDTNYTEAWYNLGACEEAMASRINDTIAALQRDSVALVEHRLYGKETKESLNNKLNACRFRLQESRDEAANGYLHSIRLKPLNYQTYFNLTRVFFSEARYDKEIIFDSSAIKSHHESDMVYVTLGNAFIMQKDTLRAIDCYEKSFRYYDKNAIVCRLLKNYFHKKGDFTKSEYYSRKLDSAMQNNNSTVPFRR